MDVHRVRYLIMYWIVLAHDTRRYRCRAVIIALMNFWVPQIAGISLLTKDFLAIQEGLCCMELVSSVVT
jgi:hypothetical protein